MGMESQSWLSEVSYDEWVAVPVPGPRPYARYKVVFCLNLTLSSLGKSDMFIICHLSNISLLE